MENIVKKQLEAYNQRNINNFCACYHDNVECIRLLSNTLKGSTRWLFIVSAMV